MKLRLSLAAVAMLFIAAYFYRPSRRGGDPGREGRDGGSAVGESGGTGALPEVNLMPVVEESLRLGSAESGADEDLAILELLLTHYRRVYETNPVGLNHEITRALAGQNSKRAAFLSPQHPAISESGELLDRWGTPFFFHQISGTEMEVISAGPDGALWTEDDVKSE